MPTIPPAAPIRGVVFDFHHTLVHAGDPEAWLESAWAGLGRPADARTTLGDETFETAVAFLDRVWEHTKEVDPDSTRDLDAHRHREVFDATVARVPGIDAELSAGLYALLHRRWDAYDDTVPVLQALRDRGVRIAVLSNVGYDLAPTLERTGIAPLLDGSVLSAEVGLVKPAAGIFQRALDVLGLPAAQVLMVGDAWADDGAAAALGIRTLILPRTDDHAHGLELVLRLV